MDALAQSADAPAVAKPAEPWRRRLIRTLLYGEQRRPPRQGARPRRPRDPGVRRGLCGDRRAARDVRGGAGKPLRAARRLAGAHLDRAARHRRPQRPDSRDRRARAVAVRRAAPHHRPRRGDRTADRGAARSRRAGVARPAQHQARLRLAQARDHAEAAARDPPARPAGRRLPRREQARLSEQRRGLAPDRPRQHRQPGHRRHREVARRPRPAGAAHGGLRHRPAAEADRARGRSARAACAARRTDRRRREVQGEGRRRPRRRRATPARSSRWCRCRTTIRTARSRPTIRCASTG